MQHQLFKTFIRRLLPGLLIGVVWVGTLAFGVPDVKAAEILSIRSATELQIGDQNRSYSVELACLEVNESQGKEALLWLQQHGTRGTKVNLRPISQRDGQLVAKVSVLKSGMDLGDAMVDAGLGSQRPCQDSQPPL